MLTASSLAWKTSLRKVRTLWHCRLRSVALYLWLIVVISVRQSTVAAIFGLHCRGRAGYGRLEHKADSLIAKIKEAANGWDWCMSRVTAIISALLSASSSACHGPLIITVVNAITYKAQRDQNARELKLANAAITDMQMRQRDVGARCKIHEGVSWC